MHVAFVCIFYFVILLFFGSCNEEEGYTKHHFNQAVLGLVDQWENKIPQEWMKRKNSKNQEREKEEKEEKKKTQTN